MVGALGNSLRVSGGLRCLLCRDWHLICCWFLTMAIGSNLEVNGSYAAGSTVMSSGLWWALDSCLAAASALTGNIG